MNSNKIYEKFICYMNKSLKMDTKPTKKKNSIVKIPKELSDILEELESTQKLCNEAKIIIKI